MEKFSPEYKRAFIKATLLSSINEDIVRAKVRMALSLTEVGRKHYEEVLKGLEIMKDNNE